LIHSEPKVPGVIVFVKNTGHFGKWRISLDVGLNLTELFEGLVRRNNKLLTLQLLALAGDSETDHCPKRHQPLFPREPAGNQDTAPFSTK
jgi:hypothetical protein